MTNYSYKLTERPPELGGGWRLRLFENKTEVGGGVFEHCKDAEGIDWAKREAEQDGEDWLRTKIDKLRPEQCPAANEEDCLQTL